MMTRLEAEFIEQRHKIEDTVELPQVSHDQSWVKLAVNLSVLPDQHA